MATLGNRIKELRTERGLNQEDLGKLFGLVKSTISLYENDKSTPDDDIKKNMAKYFNVSLDYLMGESNVRNPYIDMNKFKFNLSEEDYELKRKQLREQGLMENPNPKGLTDRYIRITEVEEAMKIILEQPGLMLKGELLSDESKIILANAIQMGLRTAEELEKKKNKGDKNE